MVRTRAEALGFEVVEGDPELFNQYGVILVNPVRFSHVKKDSGLAFMDWLTSRAGQEAIAGYRIDGQQLFFPNAVPNYTLDLE